MRRIAAVEEIDRYDFLALDEKTRSKYIEHRVEAAKAEVVREVIDFCAKSNGPVMLEVWVHRVPGMIPESSVRIGVEAQIGEACFTDSVIDFLMPTFEVTSPTTFVPRRARAIVHWQCPYCASLNDAANLKCVGCNARRTR